MGGRQGQSPNSPTLLMLCIQPCTIPPPPLLCIQSHASYPHTSNTHTPCCLQLEGAPSAGRGIVCGCWVLHRGCAPPCSCALSTSTAHTPFPTTLAAPCGHISIPAPTSCVALQPCTQASTSCVEGGVAAWNHTGNGQGPCLTLWPCAGSWQTPPMPSPIHSPLSTLQQLPHPLTPRAPTSCGQWGVHLQGAT